MPFDVEEAEILLGDSYVSQSDSFEAAKYYDMVIGLTTSGRWKSVAQEKRRKITLPIFWPMHERWDGEKTALLCAIRDRGQPRRFSDLTNLFRKNCRAAKLESVDISKMVNARAMSAFFDESDFGSVSEIAKKRGAGIVLGVLYDIDVKKRGKKQEVMGVAVPVQDSDVRCVVIRVDNGSLLYNGQFKEVAGERSEAQLGENAAGMLIRKCLIPNCPALRRK